MTGPTIDLQHGISMLARQFVRLKLFDRFKHFYTSVSCWTAAPSRLTFRALTSPAFAVLSRWPTALSLRLNPPPNYPRRTMATPLHGHVKRMDKR